MKHHSSIHFDNRAQERFNIIVDRFVTAYVIRQIKTNQANFIRMIDEQIKKSLWQVELPNGKIARVVYNEIDEALITIF